MTEQQYHAYLERRGLPRAALEGSGVSRNTQKAPKPAHEPSGYSSENPEPTIYTFEILPMMCHQYTDGEINKLKPKIPKLVGYYTKGRANNFNPRAKEYNAWKKHVVQHSPVFNLSANSFNTRAVVTIWAYFSSGTHCDVENLRKGIVDALFPKGDKWVSARELPFPAYDKENPRILVVVELFGNGEGL